MADNFDLVVYDSDQQRITFAGYSISKGAGASGYADGVFITIKPQKPSFTTKEGTDGTVTRSKTNSRLVDIVIRTMSSNSATNGFLSALLSNDQAQPNGAGVGPFVYEDLQGTTKYSCSKCWVTAVPDFSRDREANEVEWKLTGLRSVAVIGGN